MATINVVEQRPVVVGGEVHVLPLAAVVTEQTQHSTEHRACAAVDIIKLPDKATQRPRLNRCATLFFPLWQVSSLFT